MRVFHNNTEITKIISRLDGVFGEFSYIAGEYGYFAVDLPFNHLYFYLPTNTNNIAATMKVEYYSGSWTEAVNLKDETNAFFNSGYVEFTPNRNNGWSRVSNSTELGLPYTVYDKYWMRISFNVNLKPNFRVDFIGHKFSDDLDLFSEYPVFNDVNFMTAFQAGKANWEQQHVKAAEIIIQDLQRKNVVIAPEQILDRTKFIPASVCKVAEIIFTAFGNDYTEQRNAAREEYLRRLDLSQYNIDNNSDAILQSQEIGVKQGWMSR